MYEKDIFMFYSNFIDSYKRNISYESDVPYVFRQRIVVTTQYTTRIPDFHTAKYRTYDLTVVDTMNVLMSNYFKQPGTYDVIVNLKTFEITAELLPE